MCNSFSIAASALAVCAILLVGCRGDGDIDCRSRGADWREHQHESITKYAQTPVADAQVLEIARAEAASASLEIVRSCLLTCGGCEDVIINPEHAEKVRQWAHKLAVSRVEIGAERDERKSILAIVDMAELSAPVSIGFDVKPGEPLRLYVNELIAD